ncbi:DEAD/DEAH box helicase family protein [Chloroflexales bacterium ZM16-3]|nr:DEAD/DEAH box helicase family protein [Chloroflexales bacterium ZM16-3]
MTTPEARARLEIDRLLTAAGWVVQDVADLNLLAGVGVAIREFPLATGFADYLLFVDRKAIGAVEAKKVGVPLSGVEAQSAKYGAGLPPNLKPWRSPMPFLYESTGVETFFTDGRDPEPRSRRVFAFHRPETLRIWVQEPVSLRGRLRHLPPLITTGLWPAQIEAVQNLEQSLADDRPRALIQMATGSGKTFTAVSAIYRLIQHAGARRVLFLVDRSNLGRQTLREFQQYVTPDDGRKFSEIYNVQHLQSNTLDDVSRVCITTIQRLYAMLSGQELDPELEEQSLFEQDESFGRDPKQVDYNPRIPIEYFDIIVTDECHRSIYHLWRQVLEYFDAHLIGLTATPSKQTLGFFQQNLVMEYTRQRAVLDGVNVDGEVYRIRTAITEQGSQVEAASWLTRRDRRTRAERLELLDEDFVYPPQALDRAVVAEDQIRTVIRTFRERLFTEIFPGRTEVPKTLIFAKDDSHAEEIVRLVRQEFGAGNAFCQKITYRVTGVKPEELIAAFRNSYYPRIAVTVDMIATGTDIKPLECLIFLRLVKSPGLFEQMLGRGTRVINPTDLQAVSGDARRKDRFVIVDCVGVVDHPKAETQTLEHKRSVPFDKLLQAIALGDTSAENLESLAGRLATLNKGLSEQDRYVVAAASGGPTLTEIAQGLLDAVDPDRVDAAARAAAGGADPTPEQRAAAAEELAEIAVTPFHIPQLRKILIEFQQRDEIAVDDVSKDVVREAGFSAGATEKARATVESFRAYLEQHKDEITAIQLLYSQPYGAQRPTFAQVKELAQRLAQPPLSLTTEALWRAYAQLEQDKVRGAGARRVLTDLVALIRHAVRPESELEPYPEQVRARYERWLAQQESAGRLFTPAQRWWLDQIANHIGVNLSIAADDLSGGAFISRGGPLGAQRALGDGWQALLDELNEELAA